MSVFRSRYSTGLRKVGLMFADKGRTKQQFKADTDVNNILKKYMKTGLLPDASRLPAKFGDFSSAPSYLDAMNLINEAHEQFASLNSSLRGRFQNDPSQFLEFCNDPKNLPEMLKLGLATERSGQDSLEKSGEVIPKGSNPPKPAVGEGPKA